MELHVSFLSAKKSAIKKIFCEPNSIDWSNITSITVSGYNQSTRSLSLDEWQGFVSCINLATNLQTINLFETHLPFYANVSPDKQPITLLTRYLAGSVTVKELLLDSCKLEKQVLRILFAEGIAKSKSISVINLSCNSIDDGICELLVDQLLWNDFLQLQELSLIDNHLTCKANECLQFVLFKYEEIKLYVDSALTVRQAECPVAVAAPSHKEGSPIVFSRFISEQMGEQNGIVVNADGDGYVRTVRDEWGIPSEETVETNALKFGSTLRPRADNRV